MAEWQPDESPRRVGVREFRGNLTGFLRQARQGRSFLIVSRDQVLAEVGPPPQAARPPREPGALPGKMVGVVSLWEIAVKTRIGRLQTDIMEITDAVQQEGFTLLDIGMPHLAWVLFESRD
jgi:antitoxin (DNA-binding transcriptional repressor) of toxin-antitoxin stability system